ncbi:MAG: polyprenyl synthetase family protein [Nitrosomonas sp.]|uniref:polyprenyl synthetase family protein n=1 Tax=Nitrosomonas oligotropha TaxID=42354 RepID=UPI000D488B8D|nr:farnesyl diphosphate synthase [Nitrosomonas oligotropha]MBL8501378.1 polyprenyl synthetase family protein [Nitrosomonas sp.]MCG7755547.1 polyprenyl synthetase family protein [Nitrosomonas sp.]MXS82876.1 geranyl transferase [Nitrosomonas oligotropha]UJO99524.1 MAG: polyprenyl synthetase family protein [Nitrosomonas sp.]UJP06707.1 MAG: polyprenyl synthetase family protein [Nitrosomonas sp.]
MSVDFQSWASGCQARIETFLDARLPASDCVPVRLHKAMRYSVLGGGKRVRPLLSFAAGELAAADVERVTVAAAAVELIHAYSLVHDDLPCMDDDVLRRGKPTCHIEFDEATALLTGDSLQTLAFELLAEKRLADTPEAQLEMIAQLALASGSRGMAGGQAFDLDSVGKMLSLPELEFMHIHKTGALIRAAVMLGARCSSRLGDEQLSKLDHFAKCVGLAFQVVDDLLDAEATTATLGKTAGKDAENNKPTYVSILGISQARELAEKLQHDADQALDGFGEAAARLRQVTDFIIKRKF